MLYGHWTHSLRAAEEAGTAILRLHGPSPALPASVPPSPQSTASPRPEGVGARGRPPGLRSLPATHVRHPSTPTRLSLSALRQPYFSCGEKYRPQVMTLNTEPTSLHGPDGGAQPTLPLVLTRNCLTCGPIQGTAGLEPFALSRT